MINRSPGNRPTVKVVARWACLLGLAVGGAGCGLAFATEPVPTKSPPTLPLVIEVSTTVSESPNSTSTSIPLLGPGTGPQTQRAPTLEELMAVIAASPTPFCRAANTMAFEGSKASATGSTPSSTPETLTRAQQAEAIEAVRGVTVAGRDAVELAPPDLTSEQRRAVLELMDQLDRSADQEPADGDVRVTFQTIMGERGSAVAPMVESILRECPGSAVAKLFLIPG